MSDSDLIKLYSQRILALAADIPHLGTLADADGHARKRAPMCGSTVAVDLRLKDGRIAAFAQDVQACALGQASASVLGDVVLGRNRAELQAARDALEAMLRDSGPTPDAPFDGLAVLIPAREYPNRHASVLLAFEATLAAFDAAVTADADRNSRAG
ncbi:iron-sulfur cluster assembly scaffold protein [Phaeovulum sp. W22_SRMD_FR3]|uniref:iron-sulfur cluster assembly scaffold protein n=1 Tax=Phaeovulum sp. W22_SRMD_FR3 TaxID=3240274 RepID=UPI003F950B08